jgi:hypothetical protein
MSRAATNNAVEKHIAGSGDNTMNITVSQERDDSSLKGSNNNNATKIPFRRSREIEHGHVKLVFSEGQGRRMIQLLQANRTLSLNMSESIP